MDRPDYMPVFIAETREHLEQLNLAILRLEEDPGDRPTVDEIFRIAHSLKGMSAAMGFAQIAALTHEIEDVFELLRQRTGGLATEAIDTVFACLDALSDAVEAIADEGEERLDPTPLVARLRTLVRERTPEQQLARSGGIDPPDLAAAKASGARVLHVEATLADDAPMPAVRAYMLFAALAEHGELIGSVPSRKQTELFSGRRVEVWLTGECDEQLVAATAHAISDVTAVSVREPEEAHALPGSAHGCSLHTPAAEPASPPRTPRTVRVDGARLDALSQAAEELMLHVGRLVELTGEVDVPDVRDVAEQLAISSQELGAMAMQLRMVPIDAVLLRFPRLVRDLANSLGKQAKLRLRGSDTEVDRAVVEALGDPLLHLIRNALDHGVEGPEERLELGKPQIAPIEIRARREGGSIIIEIEDDGRGIEPRAVGEKAVSAGLIDAAVAPEIDMPAAIALLFAPGFSTAAQTSAISGRGVGLDAARAAIRALGGELVLDSVRGAGTTARIQIPLTPERPVADRHGSAGELARAA